MIDPWIALGTNMAMFAALGVAWGWHQGLANSVVVAFILSLVGGMAAMLAWGLTRAWA